jgi:hypothetical protein
VAVAIGLSRVAAVALLRAVVAVGLLLAGVAGIVRLRAVAVSLRVEVAIIPLRAVAASRKAVQHQASGQRVAAVNPISRPPPISACIVTDDLSAACGAAQSAVHCPI